MTARETLVARVEAHWPLLGWARWWLWQARPRPGHSRPRKVPVKVVTGGRMVAHDPNDQGAWRPWDAVRRDFIAGHGDGVGFALGDDVICLDLDDCFKPDDSLQEHAAHLLTTLDGYAERSPAGGLHLIGHSDPALPHGNRRAGRVELLRRGLITVTGDVLPGRALDLVPSDDLAAAWARRAGPERAVRPVPRARSAAVDVDDLLGTAAELRNAHRFFTLWSGDIADYPSASEADFALCRHLHFLLGPHGDAIDAAFRSSVLYQRRPANWHRRAHSGPPPLSYGQLTIRRAIACGGPSLYRPGGTP